MLILITALLILAALAWFHVLPGGWFLRNLIEDPGARARRLQQEHSEDRLADFLADAGRLSAHEGPVILLGSSTVERIPVGADFLGDRAFNRGIGGERSAELRARLDQSVPAATWPRVRGILLYAGSIDFRQDHTSVEETVDRVDGILELLGEKAPGAAVLVLGILPGRQVGDRTSGPLVVRLNQALEQRAGARGAEFLDPARTQLVDESGRLVPALSEDDWHLNRDGYLVLCRMIRQHQGRFSASLN